MTTTSTTRVQDIPPLSRAEAMDLAAAEYGRFMDLLRSLAPDEWQRQTECEDWDVRAMASHFLAEAESHASVRETAHQMRAYRKAKSGPMIDAMTALQVRDRAGLTPDEIVARFERVAPRSVRARRRMPCRLTLTGPAGGSYVAGEGGETIELDAVEFCRILSGRAEGAGLMSTEVPF